MEKGNLQVKIENGKKLYRYECGCESFYLSEESHLHIEENRRVRPDSYKFKCESCGNECFHLPETLLSPPYVK